MFAIIPLGTKGSTGFPLITLCICVACALVFTFAHGEPELTALAYDAKSYDVLKMFTSVFAHASIWHLLGNLFFFYCFARTIETRISAVGYAVAFAIFVVVTNLAFSISADSAQMSTVGLSGVVWGFMGIFLFRYPKDYIQCFVWYIVIFKIIEVPAVIFILAFLAFNVGEYRHLEGSNVNYVAHFSGCAAGALFRLMLWSVFTTEKPAPKRRPSLARAGRAARRY